MNWHYVCYKFQFLNAYEKKVKEHRKLSVKNELQKVIGKKVSESEKSFAIYHYFFAYTQKETTSTVGENINGASKNAK